MQHSEPRPASWHPAAGASLLTATLLAAFGSATHAQTASPDSPLAQGTAPAAVPGAAVPGPPAAPATPAAPGAGGAPARGNVQAATPGVAAPQAVAPDAVPAAPAVAASQAGAGPGAAPLPAATPVQPFPGATMGAPGYNPAVPQPVRPDAMPQPGRPAFAAPPPPAARAPVPALPTVQSPPVKGLPPDAPKLVINGGVHSPDPARRRVIVNGQVVREGADLGAGVVLEQIKPDSVVLGFRGEHFHVTY